MVKATLLRQSLSKSDKKEILLKRIRDTEDSEAYNEMPTSCEDDIKRIRAEER